MVTSETIRNLLTAFITEDRLEDMPILADALEDADCNDAGIQVRECSTSYCQSYPTARLRRYCEIAEIV